MQPGGCWCDTHGFGAEAHLKVDLGPALESEQYGYHQPDIASVVWWPTTASPWMTPNLAGWYCQTTGSKYRNGILLLLVHHCFVLCYPKNTSLNGFRSQCMFMFIIPYFHVPTVSLTSLGCSTNWSTCNLGLPHTANSTGAWKPPALLRSKPWFSDPLDLASMYSPHTYSIYGLADISRCILDLLAADILITTFLVSRGMTGHWLLRFGQKHHHMMKKNNHVLSETIHEHDGVGLLPIHLLGSSWLDSHHPGTLQQVWL